MKKLNISSIRRADLLSADRRVMLDLQAVKSSSILTADTLVTAAAHSAAKIRLS